MEFVSFKSCSDRVALGLLCMAMLVAASTPAAQAPLVFAQVDSSVRARHAERAMRVGEAAATALFQFPIPHPPRAAQATPPLGGPLDGAWEQILPLPLPGARGAHVMAFDEQHDRMFVFGVGGGLATVNVSRNVNYKRPDPAIYETIKMGLSNAMATYESEPFKGSADFPIEGDDVAWRFDHTSATEAPFSLQSLTLYADPRGQGRGTVR